MNIQGVDSSGRARRAWLALCCACCCVAAAQEPTPAPLAPGTTVRCSVASDGSQGVEASTSPELSADGTCVGFVSSVRNFRPGTTGYESIVFVHELVTGRTDPLDIERDGRVPSTLMKPSLSADGALVALQASGKSGTDVPWDVAVFDRRTREVRFVDAPAHGVEAPVGPYPVELAADGSCLLFQTTADFGRGISKAGCYLFDLAKNSVEPLPCGAHELWSMHPSLSADGRILVVEHMAMPKADPRPAGTYVIDRDAGTLLPIAVNAEGEPGARLGLPHISGDGRCIAYMAARKVAQDAKGVSDALVWDRQSASAERVSVSTSGEEANASCTLFGGNPLSADGRFVVFTSEASNLVPGDTNGHRDVFVRDRRERRTVRVSVASDGTQADADCTDASISADGRRVAFRSKASNLVPDDTNGIDDIFVHEVTWGAVPAQPPAVPFERSRTSDRGFERVRLVSEADDVCVLRVDTDYWGGAMGGAFFGWASLSDLCRERGFPHFVILEHHPVRHGTAEAPGNEWQLIVGLLRDEKQDVVASFPCCAEASRSYRVWPLLVEGQSPSVPSFMQDVHSSELWEVFSSIHFRFRSTDDRSSSQRDSKALDKAADKTAQGVSAAGDPTKRSYALVRAANAAIQAGRTEQAEAWARELLESAVQDPPPSNLGDVVHVGNWVLGLVELQRGDVESAKARLLKSGMTTGSPVLGSFGPNMSLARALLERGEREVVLEYFELCRAFWSRHGKDLDAWSAEVAAGRIPDFGANLVY